MDVAVVVNLKARRGSEELARRLRRELPDARVLTSRSLDETLAFVRSLGDAPPGLLLSAGGDGTAVALLNGLRAAQPADGGAMPMPLGVLPLGTGNGWAHATGAPRWRSAVAQVGRAARRGRRLPLRRFDLVEVDGIAAHFAGTGWDAGILSDFHAQKTGPGVLPQSLRSGLAGYLQGLFTRTIPRELFAPRVEVEIVNTGSDAIGVDDAGRPVPLPGGEHGKVLYRGPTSVCGAGTSPEWGFRFRAFPFAGLVRRRFCLRVYAGSAAEGTARMRRLWTGAHPLEGMHTWLVDRCRARFSRPIAFQIGGDLQGDVTDVEYALARQHVDLLDWRALDA